MAYTLIKKHYDTHLSNKYAKLTKFVGEEIKVVKGLRLYAKPESAVLLADYQNTVLIEMKFVKDFWHPVNPQPRYVRQMISKADLATGEVQLIHARSGEHLYGTLIAGRVRDADALIGEM